MEAHLQRKYSGMSFDSNRPGCMWGIFHIFHFPHWIYTRKPLLDKKQRGGKQAAGIKTAGATGGGHDNDEKVGDHPTENRKKVTKPTRKKSRKTPIKKLIAKEISKERDQKQGIHAFPRRLARTNSIHYLECTDYSTDERSTICENPTFELQSHEKSTYNSGTHNHLLPKFTEGSFIFNEDCDVCGTLKRARDYLDPNTMDDKRNQSDEKQELLQEKVDETNEAFLKQQFMNGNGLGRDVSLYPSKELLDVIDVFNENQVLFLRILQDPSSILATHVQRNSNFESVLTKCGSFPATEFSGRRTGSLIKLKQKQQEIQSHAKQDGKFEAQTTTATLGEDGYSKLLTVKAAKIDEAGTSTKTEPDSLHELKRRKENGKVMNRFKDIKQRIKQAFRESKKERLRISMDGILHRIPYGRKASKNVKSDACKDGGDSPRNGSNSNAAIPAGTKNIPIRIRRTPSLTESLERYSQLLESISSRDTKRNFSERLKLANENGGMKDRHSSRPFQRILSMPEDGSYFLGRYMDSDVPHDKHHRKTLSRDVADSNSDVGSHCPDNKKPTDAEIDAENCAQFDPSVKTESQENYVENIVSSLDGDQETLELDNDYYSSDEEIENREDATMGEIKDVLPHEQWTEPTYNNSDKQTRESLIPLLYSCIPEDSINLTEVSVSEEGSEMKLRCIDFSELDHFVNLQDESGVGATGSLETKGNTDEIQTPSTHSESDTLNAQEDREEDADFNYVRDVLKKSGFSGNELPGTWHSPDQPVDPSFFNEVECSPHKLDVPGAEDSSNCNQQLLFDLINEVLLEIYDRSCTYCPWNLCSNSSIRPMPLGDHVLAEVWAKISWHLSSQLQMNPTFEYVVARDLAKTDGWMNLQVEAESVGLELEDWILDDLLDEATYELAGN